MSCIAGHADDIRVTTAEQAAPEAASPEPQREESPVATAAEFPTSPESIKEDPAIQQLQSQLSDKDSQIASLQEQLSTLKSQEVSLHWTMS
jgi:TolA-binding protein